MFSFSGSQGPRVWKIIQNKQGQNSWGSRQSADTRRHDVSPSNYESFCKVFSKSKGQLKYGRTKPSKLNHFTTFKYSFFYCCLMFSTTFTMCQVASMFTLVHAAQKKVSFIFSLTGNFGRERFQSFFWWRHSSCSIGQQGGGFFCVRPIRRGWRQRYYCLGRPTWCNPRVYRYSCCLC